MLEKLLTPADELYDAVEAGDEDKVRDSFIKASAACHSFKYKDENDCSQYCVEGDTTSSDLNTCYTLGMVSMTAGLVDMFSKWSYYYHQGFFVILPMQSIVSIDQSSVAVLSIVLGCMATGMGYLFAIKNKAYSAHRKYAEELRALEITQKNFRLSRNWMWEGAVRAGLGLRAPIFKYLFSSH